MAGRWTRKRLLVLLALLEVLAVLYATTLLIRPHPRSESLHDDGAGASALSFFLLTSSTTNNDDDPPSVDAPDPRKGKNDAPLPPSSFVAEAAEPLNHSASDFSPSDLEVQRLVELVPPRAFPRWNSNSTAPVLPCPPAEDDWTSFRAQRARTRTGFLFVKVPKTGSSTTASVNLRIASRVYQKAYSYLPLASDDRNGTLPLEAKFQRQRRQMRRRRQRQQQQQQQLDSGRRRQNRPEQPAPPRLCKNRIQHASTPSLGYDRRHRSRSVLWTVVRDPTDRAVSEFFHFHVSRRRRRGINASDDQSGAFRDFVRVRRRRFRNFQVAYLSLRGLAREEGNGTSYVDNGEGDPTNQSTSGPGSGLLSSTSSSSSSTSPHPAVSLDTIRSILRDYDFVGVSERMEESLVALQLLLELETPDILHLSSKVSGGYDDGLFQDRCVYIQPSFRTPSMQEFFSGPEWRRWTKWDEVLHRAANRSLDLTIAGLGRAAFRDELEKFRALQRRVHAACSERVRFPCDASRHGLPPRPAGETDCLLGDMGCGFGCIDELVVPATDRL